MTRTKKHDNTKPCGKSCAICYPINDRTSRTRRRDMKKTIDDEMRVKL